MIKFIVNPTNDFVTPDDLTVGSYPEGVKITLKGTSTDQALDPSWQVVGASLLSIPAIGTLHPYKYALSRPVPDLTRTLVVGEVKCVVFLGY